VSLLAALTFVLAGDSIPAIVPRPAHVTVRPGGGAFTLKAGTVIVTDRALRGLGELLGDYLFPATGLRLAVRTGVPAETQVISIRLEDPDGAPLPAARPGQFLTLRVPTGDQQTSVLRSARAAAMVIISVAV